MSDNGQDQNILDEAFAPRPPLFFRGNGDDPNDPGDPQNIPAVVAKYLSPHRREDSDHMRNFSFRMSDLDFIRLSLLAEALGAGKTVLARELLDKALSEAYRSLPDEMREELHERLMEEL